ncbi:NAD(P)-dependent oxidoreductase [Gordonia crocea]|uniref:D-glycerate dehydrogenase n=1 Tax=Gordonia crocea TaxID=589162 RepID=A0A7I9V0J0_9ACTN|nr:NAD(P)-dependent oxidoreductase [Gordonia crocea]GED98948.1 hypothetical protein nbrc107697_29870 [Gordonia crocea]
MTTRVLVTIPAPVSALDGPFEVVYGPIGSASDAEALLVGPTDRVDGAVLDSMPSLSVVAVAGAGTDAVDQDAISARGITLVSAPEATVVPTAELAVCLILMVSRGVPAAVAELDDQTWPGWAFDHVVGRGVAGLTLGLVGYGRIARRVADMAAALGMTVLHHRRTPSEEPGFRAELPDLLAASDVVSIHVPRTPETVNLIGAREIALMPPGSALVNTSRGGIVDEDALLRALASGHLSGAGVDVFVAEPGIPSRLLGVPNLVVTPHIGSATAQARAGMAEEAAAHLLAALDERRGRFR